MNEIHYVETLKTKVRDLDTKIADYSILNKEMKRVARRKRDQIIDRQQR